MPHPGLSDLHLQEAERLYRAGRLDEAAGRLRQYLRTNPRHVDALHSLGMIYFKTEQYEEAAKIIGEALQLDPFYVDGIRLRGMALMHLQRHDAALECFERALSLRPGHIELLVNHATALLELKRFKEAVAEFDRVLKHDPNNAIGWNNRGNALVAMGRLEEAVDCYDRGLAIQPDLPTAEHNRFLAQLKLRRVSRMPSHALRAMFDEVASRYDAMMDELCYRSHLHLRTLAERVLPRRGRPWRILDLGCGTGLAGDAFKDMAAGGRLDGIDIAPRMIDAARERGIYDDLVLGDLETVLAAPGALYDLIVSADTMVYLGDLAPAFSGVAHRLEPGGFYLFACEAKDGEGWEQTPANRFAHSERYLREETAHAGLSFVDLMECSLRRERDQPIAGYAVALRKAVAP